MDESTISSKKTTLFDAHCHLQDTAFNGDRAEMIAESRAAGVSHFLVPATDSASFAGTLELTRTQENIYCALGIHPHSASEWNSEVREQIRSAVQNSDKLVAIGEIGLDYHYDFAPRNVQIKAFEEQIALAIELQKPIVIHTRESEEDVFRIVGEHYTLASSETPRGQFHCFSAGMEWMERAVSLGFHVSFTGNITFKNSNLAEVVRETPLDRLLIETDSPYLTPAPNRGKRNSPAMLPFIAGRVSELKQLDISVIMQQTFANTLSLFRIPSGSISKVLGSLILAFVLLLGAANVYAQQPAPPAGTAPPDSILTGERRKAAELRKKQEEELAREAELRKQDSIKAFQQEQSDAQAKAREQMRQDSTRAAEQVLEEERRATFLLTPQPWRAVGFGGNLGVGSMHAGVNKQQLTPTSVLAYGFQLKTEVTHRLDISASFTHYEISDNFPQDSVYTNDISSSYFPYRQNLNPLDPAYGKYPYIVGKTRLIQSESLGISMFGIDLDYVITKPSSLIKFYFGVGYQHFMMKGLQNYLPMVDTLKAASNQQTFEQDWSRNGIDLLFGLKNETELGNGLTLEPFAEISTTGVFNGPTQFGSFVFQPDKTDLITVNVRAGITLYYGWWGVPRE